MQKIGIVSEGVTDLAVLKNILIGWFKGEGEEPAFQPYQPDLKATGESSWQTFGNWENVLKYIQEKKYYEALEFSDYLVIQIDTDCSEHPNFGVPQSYEGAPLEPIEIREAVVNRLKDIIKPKDLKFYEGRLFFAVCVREIECWLLPLWNESKQEKTEGCTTVIDKALNRKNMNSLNKNPHCYDSASKGYKKQSTLEEKGSKNTSLRAFLDELPQPVSANSIT